MEQSTKMIRQGLKVSFPIVLGYIPVALTYGVIAGQAGLTLTELTFMSMFVYAGASQFMGVNMIAVNASVLEIVIATFVLNFRHFIMNLALMNDVRKHITLNERLIISAGLTDETFAVATTHKEEAENDKGVLFYFTIIFSAYFSWVIGSFIGGVVGEIIPDKLSQSMGVALYAMFIGLLVPSVKKEWRVGFIAVIAMLICYVASFWFSTGWAIVSGTLIGGFCGIFLLEERAA